jgi:predicted ABC-class ATPase
MSYRGEGKRGGGGRSGGRGGSGGRGEYYKNKYGRGGRGSGRSGGGRTDTDGGRPAPSGGGSFDDLQNLLRRLDGKSYAAYHDLDTDLSRGWANSQDGFTLYCERAQSDPFAPPTRCRVVVDATRAGFPRQCYSNRIRSMALADYLLRTLHMTCKILGADSSINGGGRDGWKGPKGGDIQVLEPCQHVLEQSAVRVDQSNGNIIAQITINLPARGRSILGQAAETILCQTIPTMVERLRYASLSEDRLRQHIEMVEDQVWLREQLESRNIVAFIRNGAILPRKSGADDRPMDPRKEPVPFESPPRLEIDFTLPNAGTAIKGMGIPKGISLICGGGFHGKSTLLETLQLGVYPKIPGDGREFCATSMSSVKIRAEDGRNVRAVDISNFINNLPFGTDTTCFSSEDASGSTSQAASIVEVSFFWQQLSLFRRVSMIIRSNRDCSKLFYFLNCKFVGIRMWCECTAN